MTWANKIIKGNAKINVNFAFSCHRDGAEGYVSSNNKNTIVFYNYKFYMANIPSTTQPIIPEAKSDSLSIELFLPFQFPLLSNVPRIVMLIIILSNFCAILFGLYCMFVKAINKFIHTIDIFNLMLYHIFHRGRRIFYRWCFGYRLEWYPIGLCNIPQARFR